MGHMLMIIGGLCVVALIVAGFAWLSKNISINIKD